MTRLDVLLTTNYAAASPRTASTTVRYDAVGRQGRRPRVARPPGSLYPGHDPGSSMSASCCRAVHNELFPTSAPWGSNVSPRGELPPCTLCGVGTARFLLFAFSFFFFLCMPTCDDRLAFTALTRVVRGLAYTDGRSMRVVTRSCARLVCHCVHSQPRHSHNAS